LASSTASSGAVIAITGTSGAGKGTLEQELMRRMPELDLAVSATTRERRPTERDGREYHFVSEEEFERLVQEGAFLEHVTHPWGPRHGTLRSEIDRIRGAGRVPLLDLETHGALVVRDEVPGAVTVFVKAPTMAELERRLRERATESGGEIEERLAVAREQLALEDEFDHVVVNDDLKRAVDELEAIVHKELRRAFVDESHATDRSFQTDARAEPARPEDGVASDASAGSMAGP
jgi:guanylate kinase